jgi:hypothetical protein
MTTISPLATLILEYGDSLTRMDGERDLQKQIVTRAESECHVQPAVFKTVATAYHKDRVDQLAEFVEQQLAQIESLRGGAHGH